MNYEKMVCSKVTLSWLRAWGLDLSHRLTLSAGGGLCAKCNLHNLPWQAWLGLLGHCHFVTCTSHAAVPKRLPLIRVRPSVYIQCLHKEGFFCSWITWTIPSLCWLWEACYLVLLPLGAYLFSSDPSYFPITYLHVWTSFLLPSPASCPHPSATDRGQRWSSCTLRVLKSILSWPWASEEVQTEAF